MRAQEIRQAYLDFFQRQGHTVLPSASLLPENDPSTLFTSSGMQPLVPYLMGEKHPAGVRLANSQLCFRAGDINEVGDSRHNTFFEMLGNWSLGDYFKKEQISWLWQFLTEIIGLDPRRLYVTVFRGNESIGVERDETAREIWQELFRQAGLAPKVLDYSSPINLDEGRIFFYGEEKNWWSRSGAPDKMPVGEIGGPDSEVFYDLGADRKKHENSPWRDKPCHPNCDCGRFLEIGNSVFIEFIKTADGFAPLRQKNVDFGGGLERLAMAAQDLDNVFATDLFWPLTQAVEDLSGRKYQENRLPFEIIVDHLKAAVFILSDPLGVKPSNLDQGYIVRRLIRRALRYGRVLGIQKKLWLSSLTPLVGKIYENSYDYINQQASDTGQILAAEEEKFSRTLARGLTEFSKLSGTERVSGQAAFNLFQYYGFPLEITTELAAEKGLSVDEEGFRQKFREHQLLSRSAAAGKFKGGLADHSEMTTKLHTAAHLTLAALRQVLGQHVLQKGSNITTERLRFDFSHPEKMSPEQIKQVEDLVNGWIKADLPVKCEEMTLENARATGAMGVFASRYGDKVKVYSIGNEIISASKEICGGPHIVQTGQLGVFKIIKEESSSAGIRRLKAVLN